MATISFVNLDQSFSVFDASTTTFFAENPALAGFEYSFLTNWPHDWEFDGAGITTAGGLLTGGTVNSIQVDLDNDNEAAPEIVITGLGGVAATSFGIGSGTVAQQRESFWGAALGGDDTFNFVMANYTVALTIAGDGAAISSGTHVSGEDSFVNGGTALTGDGVVAGDYYLVEGGNVTGGYDQFTVGAKRIVGDFYSVDGALTVAVGAGDAITPGILDDNAANLITIVGDAYFVSGGTLTGGGDLIDLTTTDVSGLSTTAIYLIGDFVDVGLGTATGGSDTIYGSSTGDAIWGEYNNASGAVTGGADYLYGAGGADSIDGQGGDDFITGGAGADNLNGGDGANDWLLYDDAVAAGVVVNLQLNLVSGDAVATGDAIFGFEHVLGSSFADSLTGADGVANGLVGGAGGDVILGMSGADFLDGGAGADTLSGGDDIDTLRGGTGADSMDGGAGSADRVDYSDAATGVSVNLQTNAVSGDAVAAGDTISGFESAIGGNGADSLTGDGQANYLSSTAGSDTMFGGAGADTLSGGSSGADWLYGEGGADQIYADADGGFADGGADNDSIFGAAGADTIKGGSGADIMDGAGGLDTANYADATAGVNVNLNSGTGTGDIAQGDVLANIESVSGGNFNDTLTGAHGVANWIGGGFGDDSLNGFSGNDTIVGGSGNDTLIGNFGADSLDGGAGTDIAVYSDATARVVVRLWNGTGEGNLAQGDVLTGIENLQGSNFNDILFGADGVANWISGGNGPDYLNGLSGNDTLVGGAGNDSLAGGSGADRLDFSAGSGADRVFNMITGAGVFDVIRITGYGAALDTFAEILAATTQVGADAVINLGGGNTITLVNTLKTSLVADDFLFV